MPVIPFHDLRHTAATILIAAGADVRTISARLGHALTSTTLNIYHQVRSTVDTIPFDLTAVTDHHHIWNEHIFLCQMQVKAILNRRTLIIEMKRTLNGNKPTRTGEQKGTRP